jgi:type VI secretion system protein ImpA
LIMLIDTISLLQTVSTLEPAGPNLEYSPDFAALDRAAQGTPDRQMGSAVLPGQPPDPDAVVERAHWVRQPS